MTSVRLFGLVLLDTSLRSYLHERKVLTTLVDKRCYMAKNSPMLGIVFTSQFKFQYASIVMDNPAVRNTPIIQPQHVHK